MSGVLVDSDVVINVLRQRDSTVLGWRELTASDQTIFISPVSLAEVFHGMKEAERAGVETFVSGMTCLPLGEEIGRRAGDYLRSFNRSHNLQIADSLIAATASIHGLRLWTHNRKHFPMKDVRFHFLAHRQ